MRADRPPGDRSEFAVTVMYQKAENGGHFEYYPGLRSAENDNHETIEKTLRSDGEGAVRLPSGPGSLAIVHGRNALQRRHTSRGAPTRDQRIIEP